MTFGLVLLAATLSLDGSWAFRFEEGKSIEEVAKPDFEATDAMAVPGCYDMMPKWYHLRGTGLYRRTFTLDQAVDNAWLDVDGIGLRGKFMIDGRDLGVHPYPYARLELETGSLAAGEHTVFAALDNRLDWKTMKLAQPFYDFYFYGGIYRGLSLKTDNRRIFVRTRDYATGTVEIEAVNFPQKDFDATLVFDSQSEMKVTFKAGQATVRVPDFKLWSPEHPNLHIVKLSVSSGSGKDSSSPLSARFGIRTVEARDRRIFLNGKPIFLKGVNRHEQCQEFGATTTESQMVRDLQILKGMNANFIRGAHYQQDQRFLDLCDEYGMLVWEESLGWQNGRWGKPDDIVDPEFIAGQVEETRQMVRNSFNHPSVIIFGFLNECASNRRECKDLVDFRHHGFPAQPEEGRRDGAEVLWPALRASGSDDAGIQAVNGIAVLLCLGSDDLYTGHH